MPEPPVLPRGVVAGAVAWMAMDAVLQWLRDHESATAQLREDAVRGGVPALEVAAARLVRATGLTLSDLERQQAGTMLQWVVGMGVGVLYAALWHRVPAVRAGRGLVFGAAVSLVVDEALVPSLGLSPGPRAFPWQTHVRGLAGHLVYGFVAHAVLDALNQRR